MLYGWYEQADVVVWQGVPNPAECAEKSGNWAPRGLMIRLP
jgi:hypothetical protein